VTAIYLDGKTCFLSLTLGRHLSSQGARRQVVRLAPIKSATGSGDLTMTLEIRRRLKVWIGFAFKC